MMRKFVLLLACVQNCASEDDDYPLPPYTGKCAHDPTAKALTHELLEQGYEAYKDIECVPAYLFCQTSSTGNSYYSDCATGRGYGSKGVVISGNLSSLLHVEDFAFSAFAGKITWSADTPNLKKVGGFAFYSASNAASTVVLNNAPLLETIGPQAFIWFKGNVQLVGEFSRLSSIGEQAFDKASNSANRVDIYCASDEGLTVGSCAFCGFKGTWGFPRGEQVGCSNYTTTTTTATTFTITSTTTTATSTTTTVREDSSGSSNTGLIVGIAVAVVVAIVAVLGWYCARRSKAGSSYVGFQGAHANYEAAPDAEQPPNSYALNAINAANDGQHAEISDDDLDV